MVVEAREKATVIVLVVLGIIVIGGRSFSNAGLGASIGDVSGVVLLPVISDALCTEDGDGVPYISLETSQEFCLNLSKHVQESETVLKLADWACDLHKEQEKQNACRQLLNIFTARTFDCLGYFVTNKTAYGDGIPEVFEYCNILKS